MASEVVLPFPVQPDLAATMDIQIPALAWQASGSGQWRRTCRAGGIEVPHRSRTGIH